MELSALADPGSKDFIREVLREYIAALGVSGVVTAIWQKYDITGSASDEDRQSKINSLVKEVCDAFGRADSFDEERFAKFAESATADGGSISKEQVSTFVAELLAGDDCRN